MLLGGIGCFLAGIALIDMGQADTLAGARLHGPGKTVDLGTIVDTGRRDVQSQEMAARIHRQVQLGALLAPGTGVAGPLATLGRGAQRPAVQDRGARLGCAVRRQAEDSAQILGQGRKAAGRQPALGLLVTACHGGGSFGIQRQGAPVFTM